MPAIKIFVKFIKSVCNMRISNTQQKQNSFFLVDLKEKSPFVFAINDSNDQNDDQTHSDWYKDVIPYY